MLCIFILGLFLLDGALGFPKNSKDSDAARTKSYTKLECRDNPGEPCDWWRHQCSWNPGVKEKCKKTCGLCSTSGEIQCDVGIVGGGIAGLYMAYEILKESPDNKVCIFEKDDRVGGRIRDHRFKEAPNIDVGLGAWRVDHKQLIMLDLLKELDISMKDWSLVEPYLYESREIVADNTEDIKAAYPALKAHPKFGNMSEAELWAYVLKPENVAQANSFATFSTYLSNMITSEGAKYLINLNFHKGETQSIVKPGPFLEFIKINQHLSGKYFRPHGGMSAIIDKLYEQVKARGGKIYTNTEVKSIDREAGPSYILRTPNHRVSAKKLVVAVPPGPFREIKGSIARRIQRTPQFDSILPMPAFKGGAIYSTPWWEKVKIGKDTIKAGQQFVSQDNCIGASLAYRGYGINGEGVLHTIYTDGDCARKWKEIYDLKTDYIDMEVHRALEAKYGVKIPKALATEYQYWDCTWHIQKSDTPFTLDDISSWAKRPFRDEDIFVVGEAYDPMRAWCQGAIVSCRHALKEGWGIHRQVEDTFAKRNSHEYTLPNRSAFLG